MSLSQSVTSAENAYVMCFTGCSSCTISAAALWKMDPNKNSWLSAKVQLSVLSLLWNSCNILVVRMWEDSFVWQQMAGNNVHMSQ